MSSEVNLQQADLPRSKGYLNFRTPHHLLKPPSKAQEEIYIFTFKVISVLGSSILSAVTVITKNIKTTP